MSRIKTNLALILAICLMLTSIFPAYAVETPETEQPVVQEEITETETAQQEKTQVQEQSDPEEATPDKAVYEKEASSSETEETELLTWEKEVDGIIITLTADPGIFPDGAELFAERVEDEKTEEAIEEAVEKERDEAASVASSYKFDIKMLVNGEEVQPDTSKGTVKVAFKLAEKVNDCLEVNAYHLKEDAKGKLTAETLDTEVKTVEESEIENAVETADEDGVLPDGVIENDIKKKVTAIEAETDGFSYYVVEFTYDELQYVLPGDSSIKLSVILEALAIKGIVSEANVSNETLFTVEKDEDSEDWTVTALQAFSSKEWMKLTMDVGQVYEIVVTDDGEHIHDEIIFKAWATNSELPDTAGNYYLDADVTLSETWNVPTGETSLCLNGHVIKANTSDTKKFSVITVGSGATLNLFDCQPNATHDGVFAALPEGGVITGGKGSQAGGVYVMQSSGGKPAGKFTMKGGNIVGNTSSGGGGGVYLQTGATFDMNGGSIVGNIAKASGGGVSLTSATFTMTGGEIDNNTTDSGGGGVYSDKGTFTMTGGEIDNNTAGIVGGGVGIGNGTFDMSGGKISGNTCKTNGGGVYYNNGTVTLGGTAKITDNTKDTEGSPANNVYLPTSKTVTLDAPSPDMLIGVTTQKLPNNDDIPFVPITSNSARAVDVGCFKPDDDATYKVVFVNNSQLALAKKASDKYIVSFEMNGHGEQIESQIVENKITKPDTPSAAGYTFEEWYKEAAFETLWDFDSDNVTHDITLYAKWTKNPDPTPTPRHSSGGTAYTIYTGTWNNAVSNGKWTKNADGTWSYSTRYKFTETWGCIADAGKPDSKAWYYFDRNGKMLTGWHKLYWNGAYKWYYFSKTKDANEGKCQLGGITPDGYKVGPDGAWIE